MYRSQDQTILDPNCDRMQQSHQSKDDLEIAHGHCDLVQYDAKNSSPEKFRDVRQSSKS